MARTKSAVIAAVVIGFGSLFATASPAHASQTYWGCLADGKYMFGQYPANHDQNIYSCEWSPYYRYWKYSSTCPAGTRPEATLTPTNLDGLWTAQTKCVATG